MTNRGRRTAPLSVVRDALESQNERNLEHFRELCAPTFKAHVGGANEDLSAFIMRLGNLLAAFPDAHVAVEDGFTEGTKVVARYRLTGTHCARFGGIPRTGARVSIPGAFIARVLNGRIAEAWNYLDLEDLRGQLGVQTI